MKIRIKFAKSGAMRFVGHLDIMRYFQKAIRRAGIDIAYSGGFSPHQIMSFAAPLGVGLISNGEYMDIEVVTATSSEDMKDRLNKAMVPGMEILSVTQLDENSPNAMASVAAAEYTVSFREGYEPSFDWHPLIDAFYTKETIKVLKKTKKNELEIDLKPAVFSLKTCFNTGGKPAVRLLVDASSSGNVKPVLIMQAFMKEHGQELSDLALEITREDTFTNTGTEAAPSFLPLDAVGNRF